MKQRLFHQAGSLVLPDRAILQISIIEVDDDGEAYPNRYQLFTVDTAEDTARRALAVRRCCQKRKGTTGQVRMNEQVFLRDREANQGNCKHHYSCITSVDLGTISSAMHNQTSPSD